MISSEARGAWQDLERHLRPYVARRVASAADVDDLLQEIFIKLHQGLAELRDSERFGGWVYRIARHVVADRARLANRRPTIALQEDAHDAAAVDGDDELAADLSECVALFVSRLPSPYREAITLTELQGLSQKQAAELVGVSLTGMKSRVQRGREKMRHMFEECCRISVDCRGRVVGCEPRELEAVPSDCRDAASAWAARPRRGCH